MNTNLHHEKILYLYSQALENGDFDAIRAIFEQAADDPALKQLLFELDAIYQAEFPVETNTFERLTMIEAQPIQNASSNGYHAPMPARSYRIDSKHRRWIWRVAAVFMFLVGTFWLYQTQLTSSDKVHVELTPNFAQGPITANNVDQLQEIRRYGDGVARGALWSGDEERILVYGTLGIWIYNADNLAGEPILTIPTDAAIYDADLSPDGTMLATGHSDGTLRLYRVDNGTLEWSVQAHEDYGTRLVAFNPDGQNIASSGLVSVFLWSADDGRKVLAAGTSLSTINGIAFSPTGDRLAWSGLSRILPMDFGDANRYQYSITLVDLNSRVSRTFGVANYWINDFAFTPDGNTLVTINGGRGEPTLDVWNVANIREFGQPDVRSVTMADGLRDNGVLNIEDLEDLAPPDGRSIILEDGLAANGMSNFVGNVADIEIQADSTLAVLHSGTNIAISEWNLDTLAVSDFNFVDANAEEENALRFARKMVLSANGEQVLITASRGDILLADVGSGQAIAVNREHNTFIEDFDVNASSSLLAIAESDRVSFRDIETDALLTELGEVPNLRGVTELVIFPDDETLVLAHNGDQPDDNLSLWNTTSNEITSISIPQMITQVRGLDVNAAGSKVAYIPSSEVVRLYDVESGQTESLTTNESRTHFLLGNERVYFKPGDDNILAYTIGDTFIHIITDEGQEIADLTGNSNLVRDIAFSPDGRYLASVNDDGILLIWETENWEEIAYVEVGGAHSVAFNADASLISVGGDHDISFWEIESESLVRTIEGHSAEIFRLGFTSDGSTLASLSYDGTLRLWTLE